MSVSDNSAEAVVSADGAIVGTLGTGITIVGPAERPGGELCLCSDEGVFLFNSEPGLLFRVGVEDLLCVDSEVGVCWLELLARAILPLVRLSHDDDVLALSEGISVVAHRSHDDLRVVGGRLVAGGAIIVPLGNIGQRVDLAFERSALGAEGDAAAVNPDVLGDSDAVDFIPTTRVVHVLVVEGEMGVVVRHLKVFFWCVVFKLIINLKAFPPYKQSQKN